MPNKNTFSIKPIKRIIEKYAYGIIIDPFANNSRIAAITNDLDPQYDTNYHMLETIALYDNPKIKGKTGVREETNKRSKYCIKKEVESTFEDLIKNADFKYIFLSYNDEGIIPLNRVKEIMSKYGEYKVYEQKHKRFKADNNRNYLKDSTIEYIHCLKKCDKFV